MSSPAIYYSRLDGKIERARPLDAFLSDGFYTSDELRRMEVRRTGTEDWVPLVSLLGPNGLPIPEEPMERGIRHHI